jgi:hypothetical protein
MLISETSEYSSWEHMNQRCRNRNHQNFHLYGGRGIKICDRWRSFKNFLADMGLKPTPKHTLDRFPNPAGNYQPSNCRWATMKEQGQNKNPRSVEARRQQTANARMAILASPIYRKRLLKRAAKARAVLAARGGVPRDKKNGRFIAL